MRRSRICIRWIDDCRGRRIFELLIVLWLLSACDLYFTLWAQHFTCLHELNPWASHLLQHHQFAPLALAKVGLIGFASIIFWKFRWHRLTETALWGLGVLHVMLMVQWSSYTSGALAMAPPNEVNRVVLVHAPPNRNSVPYRFVTGDVRVANLPPLQVAALARAIKHTG